MKPGPHRNISSALGGSFGIRNTTVGGHFSSSSASVVGAIDKLERIGGCIIANSVGLATFEALAVINTRASETTASECMNQLKSGDQNQLLVQIPGFLATNVRD